MKGDGIEVKVDTDAIFEDVMAMPKVEAAVAQRAANIAARARRIDAAEGRGRANIRVEKAYIPTGRAGYNVTSDDVGGEYGTSWQRRIATLRRARGGR